MNKEQRREYAKKYREKHIDKIREYQKNYWAEHGEEINAKRRNRKCYKTRCKRAIEYIEQLPFNDLTPIEVKVIYKILQGSDKE